MTNILCIYIYIYVCVCVCIYICICIYNFIVTPLQRAAQGETDSSGEQLRGEVRHLLAEARPS